MVTSVNVVIVIHLSLKLESYTAQTDTHLSRAGISSPSILLLVPTQGMNKKSYLFSGAIHDKPLFNIASFHLLVRSQCVTEAIVLLGFDVVSVLCVRYNRCS